MENSIYFFFFIVLELSILKYIFQEARETIQQRKLPVIPYITNNKFTSKCGDCLLRYNTN